MICHCHDYKKIYNTIIYARPAAVNALRGTEQVEHGNRRDRWIFTNYRE